MKCVKCNSANMRLITYDPYNNICTWLCDYCGHIVKTDSAVDGATEAIINLKRIEDYYDH